MRRTQETKITAILFMVVASLVLLMTTSPIMAAATSESTTESGGIYTYTQQVDESSTSPHYSAPGDRGFEISSGYDEDFGWMHDFDAYNQPNMQIMSVTLTIRAFDVDSDVPNGEFDAVTGDGSALNPQYLQGTDSQWSVTTFNVDPTALSDGVLNCWIDISTASTGWVTTLDYSQITIVYQFSTNQPPYKPTVSISPSGVPSASDDLVATVTGPSPADPDGDTVTYEYRWMVDVGGGFGFVDDEFAGKSNNTGNTVPSSQTANGEQWKVEITPIDANGARGTKTVVTFSEIGGSNALPVADAGGDQTVAPGATFTLDGTGSSDSDGSITTYYWEYYNGSSWTQIGGNAATVQHSFASEGSYTVRLTVTDDNGATAEDQIYITVDGDAAPAPTFPEIVVKGNGNEIADGDASPDVGDDTNFGSAAIAGGTVSHTFTIENTGDADLTLSGTPIVAISGANAGDFTVTAQPSSPVAAGGSTTFTVQFDPSATGVRSATISIANDDADENPYNFDIQGTGTAPDMDIEQNGSDIASGGSYNFGDLLRDQSSTIVFTIKNEGDAALNLSGSPFAGLSGDAAFSIVQQPTSPIAPGASATFSIKFAPTDTGAVNATLSIASDDPTDNPYTISLSGRGIFPFIEIYASTVIQDGDMTPSVDDSTDFGLRHIPDGVVTRTFYVENVGNADLVLTAPGVVLTGSSDFSISTQVSPLTIVPGDKKTFAVTYTPSVNDTVQTTLSLAHNSDDSPYTFAMQAVGGLEEIEMTAAEEIANGDMHPTAAKGTDFGDVYTRETQDTLSMTIKNTGNWPLDLSSISSSNSPIFSILVDPAPPAQLLPDSSLTFGVIFDPETDGPDSSLISIVSSDADATPFTFLVKGEGTWLASIKATVWYDKNADGTMDAAEEGIRDVMVYLNQKGNEEAYAKHLTNAGGWAKFNKLKGQDYVVTVDPSTIPNDGVCTTGSLSKTVTIGVNSQIAEAKFGIFWEDTTSIEDHISDTKLPWDADLIYHSGSPEFVKEPWSNAVDKDLFGWDGTATVKEDENGIVWGVFEVEDGPCQFNRVTMVTDDGDDDNHHTYRQVQELDIYVSTTGPDSADFSYAATVIRDDNLWPPIYKFEQTFVAKYVKIVIVRPDLGEEWRQIVEFALGELDEVLALPIPKRTVEAEAVELPTEYSLSQNYPNPFNPATTISYTLPDAQNVDIAVYNIKGDLVKQLASGYQDAGLYNVTWDATNDAGQKVTTGVYFYRIKAGSFTDTKKMTLMQ